MFLAYTKTSWENSVFLINQLVFLYDLVRYSSSRAVVMATLNHRSRTPVSEMLSKK